VCNKAIDWGATGDYWSGIGTIAGAVAVIITANRAAKTFSSWKAERLAERRIVHAENILSVAYKAQRMLHVILASDHTKDEARVLRQMNMEPDFIHRRDGEIHDAQQKGYAKKVIAQRVYLLRFDDVTPELDEIFTVLPFAKAFWGDEMVKELQVLRNEFSRFKTELEDVGTIVRGFDTASVISGVDRAVKAIEAQCIPTLQLLAKTNPKENTLNWSKL
jgi:hypothetical protein